LMDSIVFAINWKQRDFVSLHRDHHNFTRGYENFLVSQRDRFSLLDGFVGSGQADDADRSRDDEFNVRMRGDAFDPLRAKKYFGIGVSALQIAAFAQARGALTSVTLF
jgi:hypothetical protein